LAAEDRLAFGLTASHLSYLVVGSLAGYAILASGLPGLLKYPAGLLFIGVGALLAWGRLGRRPLDTWAWLAARYYLRPRRSPTAAPDGGALVLAADSDDPPEQNAAPASLAEEPPELHDNFETSSERAPAEISTAEETSTPEQDTEPRILTLPAHFAQVADGTTEYRVATEPEAELQPPEAVPVFLA